ncbi:hypothetical protein K493DRAFT_333711 [Basidiobolus meristosporus CBS 931.73]|uniref:Uncharacterized protein n=1 Tax=Basidiobolus meristosporus CBS 931.73 TaxID=1314790 RepID=A0A1Y1Z417_9FUNG|nr:hypothetical protein K493DRAFT_333711 [Basidiobolus meristosporus CBS 931.73]|eukprot:ORY05012.1 hypothetical protein K493DRAFT_333711 [Basidiobolus meristosporus CBS 931.73]
MMLKDPELSEGTNQLSGEDGSTLNPLDSTLMESNHPGEMFLDNHQSSKASQHPAIEHIFDHPSASEGIEYMDVLDNGGQSKVDSLLENRQLESMIKDQGHLDLNTDGLFEDLHESHTMMDDIFDAKQTEDILRKVGLDMELGGTDQDQAFVEIEEAIRSIPGTPGLHYDESTLPMVDQLLEESEETGDEEDEDVDEEDDEDAEEEDEEDDEDDEAARQALSLMLAKYGDLS